MVAHTDLGCLGMMLCWDSAHPELWRAYAGQVDMMVICSSPPDISRSTFCFPPDVELTGRQLGPMWAGRKEESEYVFGCMLDQQTAWLGVPAANSVACGDFKSPIPNGRATLLGFLSSAPGLVRYMPRAGHMTARGAMIDGCRIVSPDGKTLAHRRQSQGEGFAITEVTLPVDRLQPREPQPDTLISRITYFVSDTYLPNSVVGPYNAEMKKNGKRNKA